MRENNWLKFAAVIIVIALLSVIAFVSPTIQGVTLKGANGINYGIDIRGGVDTRLYAKTDDNKLPSKTDLDAARVIIEKRLTNQGITDKVITANYEQGYIIVQIPTAKGIDPKKALDIIGKTAKLTFQEVDENKKDKYGNYLPTGKIIVQGAQVTSAQPTIGENNSNDIKLTFNDEGAKAFGEATSRLVNKPIAIFMDQDELMHPTVEAALTNGVAYITGQRTPEEAKELADLIRAGALPFNLEQRQLNYISPTLGSSALQVSVRAGIVALILVFIFMLAYYRLPGIFANIALWGHTVLTILAVSWLNLSLTLPGIAGIILTIGMGVDANVIIFERIKEELKNGKTLRAAIDVGFKRAFSAIFDANMSVLIVAAVLYKFGTGAMVSFAYTLAIGVILSFLTAVTASRIMLRSVANVDIAKHHSLYGA